MVVYMASKNQNFEFNQYRKCDQRPMYDFLNHFVNKPVLAQRHPFNSANLLNFLPTSKDIKRNTIPEMNQIKF